MDDNPELHIMSQKALQTPAIAITFPILKSYWLGQSSYFTPGQFVCLVRQFHQPQPNNMLQSVRNKQEF
ncbi:hypothetical protein BOTCAL_0478g00050 [Botryotinia calthae]|uniref:Uncharacterized protein n=1 Tax=Botryotinia calthae TaxID=38488 RepID=A0A4Y8CMT3_9HELO|nr:hypothetical protein BOTCAL_0478g00050 [Botryotinia calthae]